MRKKLFIAGKWVEARAYATLFSPYSGDPIAEIPAASVDEADRAIEAACEAKAEMAGMPAHRRSAILYSLSRLLEERADEAARLIAAEAAKPVKIARTEVERTIQTYRFSAEEAKRIRGKTVPMDAAPGGEGRIAYTVREPVGVVGAIAPFNFPMNLVAHKVGPAIASGNAVVLKPASQTPLSAFFLGELLEEAGLPPGALNIVTGSGARVGNRIVQDDRVGLVTFTGSPSVGMAIRSRAGWKRVILELGSNAALIVDKDADVAKIVPRCVQGAFSYQGQICISLQRIYVHEAVYETFVSEFVEAVSRLRIGDPLDPDVDLSAMISSEEVGRSVEWIEEAVTRGARVACGGKSEGRCLQPTVLLEVDPACKVSCQEAFAPIVLINRIRDAQEGVERVNDSRYGLQAGIYTENLRTALDAAERLRVGGVIVNDIPTFRVDHMPYGGVKESGLGREGVEYAVREMTELKLVVFNRH
ncbi:aldehyde dehydrogenase family protein [Cohnella sp. CFH 77786]|uniref:aldehyde dehydrogenase family protein n=1 Tax=Cohnella sp. CFH 77786 TaxID=2662265 RepID=UPI001C608951|nr:aldehyde dehydrogenase family protein [Cohnella sp. CFH 77786]MBW5448543.1 aldehyde dehydrogenase family protein [Cohnella sp. CFH 77786]